MSLLFNQKLYKDRRKWLRNNRPKPEIILWQYLRKRNLLGYKFRRQHGIGPFIVDFYCPKLRLAIEVDGDSHFVSAAAIIKDKKRQRWIEQRGIRVIRFRNDKIMYDIASVLERLQLLVESTTTTPNPS
ncbi:MAG: endonuclease domain-containing protein [Patescibacteria group bacterium]